MGLTPLERVILRELLDRYGLAAVEQAFSDAARLGKRPVPYAEQGLRRAKRGTIPGARYETLCRADIPSREAHREAVAAAIA